MGNQTSRVLEKTKDKKKKTPPPSQQQQQQYQCHSTVTPENKPIGSNVSHGNYDWIDQNELTTLSDGTLNAALQAARLPSQQPTCSSSNNSNIPVSRPPRRKSITEYFTKRRPSSARPNTLFTDFNVKEFDRWQRQHYLLKSARKTNAWAPFYNDNDKGVVILDVGTGNGIWALEIAQQYPSVQVLGLDRLLPNDPNGPENLRFCPLDITESWPMSDNSVNFIFQRSMCDTLKQADWSPLLAEMYRVLQPGGYIELIENDFWQHNPGPVQRAFDDFIQEQCQANGVDFHLTESLDDLIKTCGFEEIEKRTMDIPLGEWPEDQELKQFGFINKEAHKALLKNHKDIYIKQMGISCSDYDLAVQEILEEFDEYHSFTRLHCWVARKPL